MELSVVIPAFNEESRICSSVLAISSYLSKNFNDHEIIIVNDGSTDKTVEVVKRLDLPKIIVISLDKNSGKGFAVLEGLKAAKFDKVLFSDADLSAPIEDVARLIPFIDGNDIVIGSRNLPDSVITKPQPFFRSSLGKTFPLIVRLFALPGIKDSQCGFKLFTKKTIDVIKRNQTIFDFGFDVEILFIARKAGLKIKEVGVHWGNSQGSKVRPIRDARKMLFDVFKIRWNLLTGRYNFNVQYNSGDAK